ncbi:MAG TPA: hypothetical protein VNF99_19630 [Stellaceae bacterium]|nr:hypothetical protein [Stellaceae bacterium]
MSSILAKLKSAGARIDGLQLAPDGKVSFVATNAGGAWREDDKHAVRIALGLAAAAPTPAQRQASLSAAIQCWLDRTAQGFGYDNLAAAASYAGSSVALWQKQATAFVAWRDAVWLAAIERFAQPAQLPASDESIIVQLPQPSIPAY